MWAAEDIPSNRLLEANPDYLSNPELLSIILGTGSDQENALDLARRILLRCNNSLSELSKMTPKQLTCIRGVGKQKAARIIAAMELGKRRQNQILLEKPDMATATMVYNHMAPILQDLDAEEFWCLFLNQNCKLIRKMRLSRGGINEVHVDIRLIMREAVISNATILIVCHNHPSGSLRPSRDDDELAKSINRACQIMRIHFRDHVIVTDGAYYSYREEGKI